jgi:methyl-accepting chemotaxis protein
LKTYFRNHPFFKSNCNHIHRTGEQHNNRMRDIRRAVSAWCEWSWASMHLENVKIAKKLPAIIVGLATFAAIATGGAADFQAAVATDRATERLLMGAANSRGEAVKSLFGDIENQVIEFGQSSQVSGALDRFSAAYNELGPTAEADLQRLYIDQNPNAAGSKEKLDAAQSGSSYDALHAQLHPWFRSVLRMNDYYDIFLFDASGRNVYTVYKERDFGTQLATGRWKDTNLGELVRQVLAGPADAKPKLADFKPYAPSADAPAGFVAMPIKGADGRIKGVFAIQLSIAKLDKTMAPMPANGETGENTLVGADGLARNNSRFEKEPTILKRKVESSELSAAQAGETGIDRGKNAAGVTSTIAYAPVEVMGTKFSVISDITRKEATKLQGELLINILLLVLAVSALAAFVGIWFSKTLTAPIAALTQAMGRLAGGDTQAEVSGTDRGDELGEMAQAVGVFRENAIERAKLEGSAREDTFVQTRRAEAIACATKDYERVAGDMLRAVAAAAAELEATSLTMSAAADRTNQMATSVAAAAEESTVSASHAAGSAESLSGSISTIQSNVAESGQVADEAVRLSSDAQQAVSELAVSATRIGEVVEMIKGIADQTNLLALNATIEAARAGEAGKGFAIVAQEVKNLASQTGNATEDIAAQISSIRGAVEGAVSAMSRIEAVIQRINANAAVIGRSVDQQADVSTAIASAISQVAVSSQSVSADVSMVTETASETGEAAGQVLAASRELSVQASKLDHETMEFLARVRAA